MLDGQEITNNLHCHVTTCKPPTLVPGLKGNQYLNEEMDAYMKKPRISLWFGSFLVLKILCGAESLLQSLGYVTEALPTTLYLESLASQSVDSSLDHHSGNGPSLTQVMQSYGVTSCLTSGLSTA